SPKPLIQKLQTTYDKINTVQAHFEQTYRPKRFQEKKTSGAVTLVKPGKMRWDYIRPKGRVFVSDGEQITLYDPEDRQAMVTPMPKNDSLPVAFAFLWGKGKLEKLFKVSVHSQQSFESVLKLVPKEEVPNVREVYLTMAMKGPAWVTGSKVIDPLG